MFFGYFSYVFAAMLQASARSPFESPFCSFWGALGRPFGIPGRLLGALGRLLGALERLLGGSWAALGRSWAALGRSWEALSAHLGCSGAPLLPQVATKTLWTPPGDPSRTPSDANFHYFFRFLLIFSMRFRSQASLRKASVRIAFPYDFF